MAKKKNRQKGANNQNTQAAANNSSQSKTNSRSAGKQGKSQASSPKSQSGSKGDSMTKNIAIAALIILLLLAGIGFLIFGLVQSVRDNDNDDKKTESSEDGDQNGNNADTANGEGSVNGDGVSDDGEDNTDEGEAPVDEDDSAPSPAGSTSDLSAANAARFPVTSVVYRRGNDYKYGDITGSSYTVRRGDTLWQIAEARYGSGYAWTEINKANGGFRNLPNGRPVLITTGQTIILPEL